MTSAHRFIVLFVLLVSVALPWGPAWPQALEGQGEWQSLSGEGIRGTWSVDLTQSGAEVKGTITLTGSTMFSDGTVIGTLDRQQIVLGVMAEGIKQVTFSGRLAGDSISGEWDLPAIKDEGVWSGTLRLKGDAS